MVLNQSEDNFYQIYDEIKQKKKLWDLFTGFEEYSPIKLDEHDRFLFKYSKNKNILHPYVSEYLISKDYHIEFPENKTFVLLPTHDIDDISIQNKHILMSFAFFPKSRDIPGIYNILKGKLNEKYSPYNNLKKIVDIEKKYDVTSTYFFLTDPYDIFGKKYTLDEVQDDMQYILNHGSEIGFHTGYFFYEDSDRIKKEKVKLEKSIGEKIIGVRNHGLRFKTPQSWNILAEAGFQYDSSYGFYDMIGFRNGMCHPFYPYDLQMNKQIDILEIPLNIQDWTISMMMKNNPSESWIKIKQLIDTVEKFNGVLNILWHNWTFSLPTSIGAIFTKEWTKLYEKVLNYTSKKNGWITNCKDFYSHYEKNGLSKK